MYAPINKNVKAFPGKADKRSEVRALPGVKSVWCVGDTLFAMKSEQTQWEDILAHQTKR